MSNYWIDWCGPNYFVQRSDSLIADKFKTEEEAKNKMNEYLSQNEEEWSIENENGEIIARNKKNNVPWIRIYSTGMYGYICGGN